MNYRGGRKATQMLPYTRDQRKLRTHAEELMWERLRGRRFLGLKWRRQHEFLRFILDFYCPALKLVIELDGEPHFDPAGAERDSRRTDILQKHGLTVIRIENQELVYDAGIVMRRLERLVRALDGNQVVPVLRAFSPHP